MNVVIVYSHPSSKSYTFQVLEQLRAVFAAQQWNVDVSDLYAMNFQSDMSEAEYEREGLSDITRAIPDDVLREHDKIENADCVIFLYPVWWSDCPAKLKGWFDRVYTTGYAYKHNEQHRKMKAVPYGLVICTAGHPNDFLTEIGIAASMQNIMLDDRLGKRFKHKDMLILGGTLALDNVRGTHQNLINNLPAKIRERCSA